MTHTITIDADRALPVLREAARRLRLAGPCDAPAPGGASPNDAIRDALISAIAEADRIRTKSGRGKHALKAIAAHLTEIPKFLLAARFADIDGLDPAAIADRFIDELPEFAHLRGYRVRFVWQRKHSGTKSVTVGACQVTSVRDRLTWDGPGPAPWWTITLALDWWLLADEPARLWAVHHELMHADVDVDEKGEASPDSREHDTEEFYATAGRFGPKDPSALLLARHTLAHPSVPERAVEWRQDATGQGLLFAPWSAA
jgi:hypothetical protein